ncbi:hypothetical protein MGH68_19470 [Erysipelothrix sp. D19-032]
MFLMGEYAVMEPGFPSVVMVVDKTIITEIYAADEFTIVSQYGQLSGKTLLTDTEGMRYVSAKHCVLSIVFIHFKNRFTSLLKAN